MKSLIIVVPLFFILFVMVVISMIYSMLSGGTTISPIPNLGGPIFSGPVSTHKHSHNPPSDTLSSLFILGEGIKTTHSLPTPQKWHTLSIDMSTADVYASGSGFKFNKSGIFESEKDITASISAKFTVRQYKTVGNLTAKIFLIQVTESGNIIKNVLQSEVIEDKEETQDILIKIPTETVSFKPLEFYRFYVGLYPTYTDGIYGVPDFTITILELPLHKHNSVLVV